MAAKLPPKQRRFVQEYLVDLNATQAAIRAGYALKDCAEAVGYYVYALVDPRNGEIFYVGKGRGKRYVAHYAEWKVGRVANAAKFSRIDDIVGDGFIPKAACLEDGLAEDDAYTLERQLIDAIGLKFLTNAVPGQTPEREKEIASARSLLIVNEIKKIAEGNWLSEITVTVRS